MSPRLDGDPLQVFLEFDGTQLLFRTDDPELMRSVAEAHSAMVVEVGTNCVARLQVWRQNNGYVVETTSSFEVKGGAQMLLDFLKLEILSTFIRARQEIVWLHAGVVHRHGKALVLVGPSGAGKSTLTTLLCQNGWDFLSDEMAPIRISNHEVIPYPRSPLRRIPHVRAVSAEEIPTLERVAWEVPVSSVFRRPLKIGWIVFPKFCYGSVATLGPIPAGRAALELIRNCTNFKDHTSGAVSLLTSLASAVPCNTLEFGEGREAASLLHAFPAIVSCR